MTVSELRNLLLKCEGESEVWVSTLQDITKTNKSKSIDDVLQQISSDEVILIIKTPK